MLSKYNSLLVKTNIDSCDTEITFSHCAYILDAYSIPLLLRGSHQHFLSPLGSKLGWKEHDRWWFIEEELSHLVSFALFISLLTLDERDQA